jgi:hypothetical protein
MISTPVAAGIWTWRYELGRLAAGGYYPDGGRWKVWSYVNRVTSSALPKNSHFGRAATRDRIVQWAGT